MNSNVRLQAKLLLSGNTARLFLASFLSFVFRYGALALCGYGIYYYSKSPLLLYLLSEYNTPLVYALSGFIWILLSFFTLLFISAIRLGENFSYFTRANGGNCKISLIFKFLKLSDSARALSLYFQINVRKILWLIYFSLPLIICSGCIYYLHTMSFVSQTVFFILLSGSSMIFALLLVMQRITLLRYSAAAYYTCLNRSLSPVEAIKKSIHFTDGFLTEGAVLEYSMLGWVLSCVLIIPLIYALPYIKLAKSVFVTEAVFSKACSRTAYAVNLLKLA